MEWSHPQSPFMKDAIAVADPQLLLLNQYWPQVVCDSCNCANCPVNYHRGAMKGTVEMPELLDLPLCTPLYPRLPIWDITLRHVLTERGVGQAWWCTSTALITARMLNYAVRVLLKWSLQDKQAILANMTPQRGKNFHRGLSNHIYLVCMNCSGVWNAVHRSPISDKMMKSVLSLWTIYFGTARKTR